MKISELIAELLALKEKHGDLPVYSWAPGEYYDEIRPQDVEFHKENICGFPTDGIYL